MLSSVNRYYDPSTDQFLSVDPDAAQTGQPYAFTGDDPLNASDPLGLDSVYILTRGGRIFYVGRSKNLPARIRRHLASEKLLAGDHWDRLDTPDLSVSEAAGLEQLVIEHEGINNLENARNEIAVDSKSKQHSYESATRAAQEIAVRNKKIFTQINPNDPAAATAEFQETVTLLELNAVPPNPLAQAQGGEGTEEVGGVGGSDGDPIPVPVMVPD